MDNSFTLSSLGWRPFFQQQLDLSEWENCQAARVVEQHKSELQIATDTELLTLPVLPNMPTATVGDWMLLDSEKNFVRLLDRATCFRRMAAGSKVADQLIAANIDTAFIVCALNEDFNLNRIERFLCIANDAGVEPIVVLSKADLCAEILPMQEKVRALGHFCVFAINCTDALQAQALLPWCKTGQSVVLLGSSGAGKSTLTNTLLGEHIQKTKEIRGDDGKGRHTTTRRSIFRMPDGALILDTPGMREIQLAVSEEGVASTFSDIEELADKCKFSDCHHRDEPGCAVKRAVENGELDLRRLQNFHKLMREQAINSASLAERRAGDKLLGKMYKRIQKENSLKKGH